MFFDRLAIGMTREEVCQIWKAGGFAQARAEFLPTNATVWQVRTPYQVGGRNWRIYIQFRENHLCGIHMREANGINMKPKNAPKDIVDEHAQPLTYDLLER